MTSTEQAVVDAASPEGPRDAVASDRDAELAGMAAVATSLALGELAAGVLSGVPSLTTAVGQLIIPVVPDWLTSFAISLFGVADKPVFVAGVVVVSLLIGRAVGRRARTDILVPVVVFLGFGMLGAGAALQQAGTSPVPATLTALVAAAAGLGILQWLIGLAEGPVPTADDPSGRRPFLVALITTGVAAAGGALLGNALRRSRLAGIVSSTDVALDDGPGSTVDTAPPLGPTNRLEVDGITPIVVPNEDFYRIDTALGTPLVDAATWELRVSGMVDTPLTLTYDDLRGGDVVERWVTLSCVSNEVGGGLVGNASWRGVLLGPLLDRAGVQQGAGQVVGRSVDGWDAGFPIEAAYDRDAMIAFAMNGEPLPAAHGFPARLVVPGLYGYVSATKWLGEIELTTWEGFDGYWVPRGWSKEGPIKTQSRIDVPDDGVRLDAAGPTVVAGVAWAPDRGVERVEVRRRGDAGDGTWVEAELSDPLAEAAWVQWRATLDLPSGPSFLQVRATDGEGVTQTDELAPPAPDGATGWHTIRVFA